MEKYYSGIVEQMLSGLGSVPYNHCLIRYSGDFSICNLDIVAKIKENPEVYFAVHEFDAGEIEGGYEPYLSIICDMFRKYVDGDFAAFLEECDVYYLHRPVILGYFHTGVCRRMEPVLLNEVAYEQERMVSAIENMLLRLAKEHPVFILLSKIQFAAQSTMILTRRLISEENRNIGLILDINEALSMPDVLTSEWEAICEQLEDGRRVYHIGSSNQKKKKAMDSAKCSDYDKDIYEKICNLVALLDFEQASYLLQKIERRIKFDNLNMADKTKYRLLRLFACISILTQDIPKALEICEDLGKIQLAGKAEKCQFERDYLISTAYMYQGKLPGALKHAQTAKQAAKSMGDAYRIFLAELMETQIQMSGWYNIFFCAQDVQVKEQLIEKLTKYNFKNHLAHIYVFAYDNNPKIVAQSYYSETSLQYFSKGVELAKEIGNEHLVNMAYQKNIMIAATNGMYEVSLLYDIRTYQELRNKMSMEVGRIYSSVGYNLCALGENERARQFYDKAIGLFYQLRKTEDVAEVQYNKALSCIMCRRYSEAEEYLNWCMKAVEKLHLNSLRVCNLSKLYGLLALVTILQKNRFRCEQYVNKCKEFLNCVLEKEKLDQGDISVIHDYAKVDDDVFLYTFAKALLAHYDGMEMRAAQLYTQAEDYLEHSKGNQFFCCEIFYEKRLECYQLLEETELCEKEEAILEEYRQEHRGRLDCSMEESIEKLAVTEVTPEEISMSKLDELLWQESMVVAYKSKKRQLDFIPVWQSLIDVIDAKAQDMLDSVMKIFLNHFNVDCALYVRYKARKPQVLFNNTGKEMRSKTIEQLEHSLRRNPGGFAISKISNNYVKHCDVTSIFGEDDVCSMVAVPFFDNEKLESFLITYVRMKDNWHSSVNRYMLDEDDLNMYQMLFREVKYALNRMDAYDKIYEMNTKLYLSAVTDQLTGIYNREGFYRKLNSLLEEFDRGEREARLGLMFIDLDNFKHYNDTFGHDVGDFILKKMAEIFQELSKNRGFVCRYGGDEFIIVFYETEKQRLESWAKHIYAVIDEAQGFQKAISQSLGTDICIAKEQRISCSIGIVTKENIRNEEEINAMIKQADDLLYSIKTSVKGTYRI